MIVVPMYHPAAALHQGSLRKVIEADFQRLPDFLREDAASGGLPSPTAGARVPAHLRASATGDHAEPPAPAAARIRAEAEPQQMRLL